MFHQYHYYVSNRPLMSDYEFDLMHHYFLSLYPKSDILQSVGSDDPNDYPLYIVRGSRPLAHERRKL